MDKKQLYSYLLQQEKWYKKERIKRNLKTILFFSVVYYAIFWLRDSLSGWELLLNIVPAVICAGVHFLVNILIFHPLFEFNHSQQKLLEDLRKQLSEIENTTK